MDIKKGTRWSPRPDLWKEIWRNDRLQVCLQVCPVGDNTVVSMISGPNGPRLTGEIIVMDGLHEPTLLFKAGDGGCVQWLFQESTNPLVEIAQMIGWSYLTGEVDGLGQIRSSGHSSPFAGDPTEWVTMVDDYTGGYTVSVHPYGAGSFVVSVVRAQGVRRLPELVPLSHWHQIFRSTDEVQYLAGHSQLREIQDWGAKPKPQDRKVQILSGSTGKVEFELNAILRDDAGLELEWLPPTACLDVRGIVVTTVTVVVTRYK